MFLVFSKKIIASICGFCMLLVVTSTMYQSTQVLVSASPSKGFCVVLDAGHGGIDGGSQGKSGVYERDLNLKIANKLQGLLTSLNANVVQTRTSQEGLYGVFASGFKKKDMQARKKIIEKAQPDLVVSIHMNFFEDSSAKGAQVFFKPNDETSKNLAQNMQNLFQKNLPNARKSAKEGDFYILTCSQIPSVLVECGYLSNIEEEALLLTDDYQNQVAYQIFCGIVGCFNLTSH